MDCLKSKYGSLESFSTATLLGPTRPNPSTVDPGPDPDEEYGENVEASNGEELTVLPPQAEEVEVVEEEWER